MRDSRDHYPQIIEREFYARQIHRYLTYFDRDDFLFIKLGTIKHQALEVLRRMCRFLDRDPDDFSAEDLPEKNPNRASVHRVYYPRILFEKILTTTHRKQWFRTHSLVRRLEEWVEVVNLRELDVSIRSQDHLELARKYREDVKELEDMTGLTVEDWLT